MAVIHTPSGTPSVQYEDTDTTIDSIVTAGSTYADATPIVRYSKLTIVFVTSTGYDPITQRDSTGISLPLDSKVGDIVEVYPEPGSSPQGAWTIYADTGFIQSGTRNRFRKVTSGINQASWVRIGI